MKAGVSHTITVAAGQVAARLMNEAPATLEDLGHLIQRAAEKRVDLLVLPECAYPAYLIGSIDSYRAGDHLKSQEFVEWLCERAKRHRLHIVSGFIEDTGDPLYNAAVLIDDQGREIGRARKRFLWNADHDWFTPGDSIRAFDSKLGRIGIVICAEARDPELIATLVADGAQLIVLPTCWINAARDPGQYYNPQVDFLIEARAREFGVPFVCADKWGLELAATGYVGQSRIVRADGSLAAEAPHTGDAVIAARLLIQPPRRVWVSETRRRRLKSETGLTLAPRSNAAPRRITLAAVPGGVASSRFTGGMGEALFAPMQQRGVKLAMLNIAHEAKAEQIELLAPAYDLRAIAFPSSPHVIELGSARIGCLAGQWARSFATARALVLDGAEILCCFDAPDDLPMLRTRAIENRVFVAAANDRTATIIGPDGEVLAHSRLEQFVEAVAEFDLDDAHDKMVAAKTNIFEERRLSLYRY